VENPVEKLWRTCGKRLWKTHRGKFSTGVFHRFSTGFPQPYKYIAYICFEASEQRDLDKSES
jgi:hypothetical protein